MLKTETTNSCVEYTVSIERSLKLTSIQIIRCLFIVCKNFLKLFIPTVVWSAFFGFSDPYNATRSPQSRVAGLTPGTTLLGVEPPTLWLRAEALRPLGHSAVLNQVN